MQFLAALLVLVVLAAPVPELDVDGTTKRRPRRPREGEDVLPIGFEPITREDVVARALAQVGLGSYWLGGGAHFDAPTVVDALGNNHPGHTDCTGLLAFAARYRRGPYNTDGIVNDAKGPQHRFRLVGRNEPVLPGDFIITDNGPKRRDHAGVIVGVRPGFVRLGPRWYAYLDVAHAAFHDGGAVHQTDARWWRHSGVIVRAKHITD